MRSIGLLVVVAAAVLSGLVAGAAPPDVGLVRIDAVVTDARGRVVTDLRSGDFEIVEEGAARQIDSVRFVAADGVPAAGEPLPAIESPEDEKAEAAREGTRLFAFFLDEFHVAAGPGIERARAALAQFVETRLGPRDLVLVVKPLDSLVSMRLTRDRAAVLRAIGAFEGRKGDYSARTAFEREYIAQDPERIDVARAQIAASALNAIAEHLGTLQAGRKTIVAVTEGFTRPVRRRGDGGLPSLDVVIRSANRSAVSIYPIDPRALVASGAGGAVEPTDFTTLQTLASGTGGEAILVSADVPSGFERILSDASGYYVLTFHPASADETGRFRPVSVRVTRPAVTVRTRPGYWEPFADPMVAIARAEAAAPVVLPAHTSPLIRPWFGFTRGDEGRTRVQYVWEPVARVPGDRSRASQPSRTVLSAMDRQGNVLVESVAVAGEDAASTFELEPGAVQLRIRIEDASARVLDTDVRQLIVAPLVGPLSVGTAQVFRARNAREFREISARPDPVPVVTRQFSRTDRLLVRLPVYSSEPAGVTATLVSARGQVMRPLDVLPGPTPDVRAIDLPLAGLASGEYRIALRAEIDGSHVEEALVFRVTP